MVRHDQLKQPARDRWACFACRWSAKIPLIDARSPDGPKYKCTSCGKPMVFTGNAFRPPRRGDDEAWDVAERLIRAGYRFHGTSERRSFPRTRRELELWLAERSAERSWLPERSMAIDAGGVVRWGTRLVRDREPVLVLVDGHWRQACVRLRGDGGVRLSSPVIALQRSRRFIPITSTTRVRLRGRARRRA